jgi:hypothetical protein
MKQIEIFNLLTVFLSIPPNKLSCGDQNSTIEDVATSQDSERIRLKPSGSGGHLKYSQQVNETNELQVSSEKLKP